MRHTGDSWLCRDSSEDDCVCVTRETRGCVGTAVMMTVCVSHGRLVVVSGQQWG